MKKVLVATMVILVAGAATAQARVDFNVNIDVPVPVAAPRQPAVVYQSAPQPAVVPVYQPGAPQLAVEQAPQFIYSRDLGFYVSVDAPYDIAYVDNGYYLYNGGAWYYSANYWGPWSVSRRLPSALHRHRYDRIRYYRDREYRAFTHDRQHYRGNWYRPENVRREQRERRHEERRDDHHDGRWDGRDRH